MRNILQKIVNPTQLYYGYEECYEWLHHTPTLIVAKHMYYAYKVYDVVWTHSTYIYIPL